MTMTQQPDAEVVPVPVALHSLSAEVSATLGGAPTPRKRRIRTRFDTVIVDPTNPVRPLLPDSPDRIRAVLVVHGVIGSGATNTSYGWIADTEAHAAAAAREQAGGGAYIAAANTINTQLTFEGTGAAWLALDNAATTALTVSVYADYYED